MRQVKQLLAYWWRESYVNTGHPKSSYLIVYLIYCRALYICNLMGMKKTNKRQTTYHPQTDGLVENFNCTLRAMIAKHAKTFGPGTCTYLSCCLPIGPSHSVYWRSTILPSVCRDARLPTEVALSMPKSPYLISVEDYKTSQGH